MKVVKRQRRSTDIVAIYSNRVGCRKVSLARGVAKKLAGLKKKVLLVDCDPDMALSFSVFGNTSNFTDGMERTYQQIKADKESIEWEPSTVYNTWMLALKEDKFPSLAERVTPISPALHFMYGDMRMSMMGEVLRDINTKEEMQAFERIFKSSGDYDYVILYLSSSADILNQVLFFSSTSFIVPTAGDIQSSLALKTLGHWILKVWIGRHAFWRLQNDFPILVACTILKRGKTQGFQHIPEFIKMLEPLGRNLLPKVKTFQMNDPIHLDRLAALLNSMI